MTASIHFMNGLYAIERDGEFVDVASTYHAAEVLLSSIHEAHYSNMIGGDPLLIEAQRFAERGSICAACVDQAHPCAVCDSQDDDYTDAMAEQAMGSYNGKVPSDQDLPLLAQCAAVIDACLGGPVANGGILDELRRVRAELKKAGV